MELKSENFSAMRTDEPVLRVVTPAGQWGGDRVGFCK